MAAKVYLETTVISYLAAWPSRDLLMAAHQQITQQWWRTRRFRFQLFASRVVVDEAGGGDRDAAGRRLALLAGIPLLELTPEAAVLSRGLLRQKAIPESVPGDALHVALAAAHGIDFLLTWNCRHLANAEILPSVSEVVLAAGYRMPLVCTPEELMGVEP